MRGYKAQDAPQEWNGNDTTYSATERNEKRQEIERFGFGGVRTGSRRCADWRREWYSTPSQAVRMREIRAHLTAKTNREIGAALELKRQSATCNRGQYRLRKPNTPLRKEVERETGDPEGNLVIVERSHVSANISFRAGSTVGTVLPTDSQALLRTDPSHKLRA